MDILPGALVVGALALFLTSTRQFAIGWRLAIWFAAAALLMAAAFVNLSDQTSTGLLSTLLRHPGIVGEAFRGNLATVQAGIAPVIDILVVLAAVLGIGCFIAFTPGEAVERVIRPMNIGLIGAVIGGTIVFAVSAVGFGGVSKRHVFLSYVDQSDVVDGDTLRMGDVSLRILGIDAPEDHQICLDADNVPFDCGTKASETLRKLLVTRLAYCHAPSSSANSAGLGTSQLKESFGRPLVVCDSDYQRDGALQDVGRELVRMGYADVYRSSDGKIDSDYIPERDEAARNRRGLHQGDFLAPTLWRNSPKDKCNLVGRAGRIDPVHMEPVEQARLHDQIKRLRKSCDLPDQDEETLTPADSIHAVHLDPPPPAP